MRTGTPISSSYYLDRHREEIYFVTGVPEPDWDFGLSHVDADMDALRAAFDGFHPEVQQLIDVCSGATQVAVVRSCTASLVEPRPDRPESATPAIR